MAAAALGNPPDVSIVDDRRRWYTLALLTLVYTLNIADRFVMSVLIEPIKADLGLSDASVGFLTGVALAIFYVLAGLPIATLADRVNRRNVVALALTAWSLMTALCGITRTYWELLLARIGVGVGEAGGTAPSHSLISDVFPWRQRPLALAIYGLGVSLGSALAASGGWIAEHWGWRHVFFVVGVPGVVLALLVWRTIGEPRRGRLDESARVGSAGLWTCVAFAWRSVGLRHMMLMSFAFPLWAWGLLWWMAPYLSRSHGMTVGEAGNALALMHGVGGTAVLIGSIWLMRWYEHRDPRLPLWFAAGSVILGTVPSIVAVCTHSSGLAIAMLWIFVASTYASFGPTFATLQNMAPAPMRAQVAAIALFLTNFANLVVAPLVIGLASDLLHPAYGAESLRMALIPLAALGFWGAYHFYAAAKHLSDALARAGTATLSSTPASA